MSLITSGLTWQVDFTNQSSLIISTSGGGNPQIDKATKQGIMRRIQTKRVI